MARQSEERRARTARLNAERAEEMLALPHVVEERAMDLPAKPASREPQSQGQVPPAGGTAITPADASGAEAKAYARTIHGQHLAGVVYRDQMRMVVDGSMYEETALDYASDFIDRVGPQNPLEAILAEELLWSHTRAATLSIRSCRETSPQRIRTINQAADGASNTSRKLVRALTDCRRPRRGGDTFIQQANVAGQQVVHNEQPGVHKELPKGSRDAI